MAKQFFLLPILFLSLLCSVPCQGQTHEKPTSDPILPGAYDMGAYLPTLQGKRVALLVNQSSEVNGTLLPDTLLKRGIKVVKIFSPEHGFRGTSDAGAIVKDGHDAQTGLPVISLYGKNKKPFPDQLVDVDVVVYDLQDVGVRFYTYISTLQYMMEACAESQIPLLILDRPNPLGWVVDGPVLKNGYQSFVGMQAIPVVYGMTPGEYAEMLLGEGWGTYPGLSLEIVDCQNYTHHSRYELPVAPSPNLKSMAAIYLYPSLCLFEGTQISVGRGTIKPFQQFGHPALKGFSHSFVPKAMPGASKPLLMGQTCYGRLLANTTEEALTQMDGKMQIKWLLEAYLAYPEKDRFFNNFFNTLAGTNQLKSQIKQGLSESAIRASWQKDLENFKHTREKYLRYP